MKKKTVKVNFIDFLFALLSSLTCRSMVVIQQQNSSSTIGGKIANVEIAMPWKSAARQHSNFNRFQWNLNAQFRKLPVPLSLLITCIKLFLNFALASKLSGSKFLRKTRYNAGWSRVVAAHVFVTSCKAFTVDRVYMMRHWSHATRVSMLDHPRCARMMASPIALRSHGPGRSLSSSQHCDDAACSTLAIVKLQLLKH